MATRPKQQPTGSTTRATIKAMIPDHQEIGVQMLGGLFAVVLRQRWAAEHDGAPYATIGSVRMVAGPFATAVEAEAWRDRTGRGA